VVKGVSFVNLRDAGDPVENALYYDKQGPMNSSFWTSPRPRKKEDHLDVVAKTAEDVFMA